MAGIYDTLYVLDPVARPAAIVPMAAAALPEVSVDYRTFAIRVRSGILFPPHPAFGGRPRELTAADFAYAWKRLADPKLRSPSRYLIEGKIEGLDAVAKRARDAGAGLDYDAPVSGLEIVDRYTLRVRLAAPDPVFPFALAMAPFAAVAREVVEAEGDAFGRHPLGSGAFVAASFSPGQALTLARNPAFRRLDGDDLLTQRSREANPAHPLHARRIPGADRIEFVSTPESSSELLALRRGELDLVFLNAAELAIDRGTLRPELAREGLQLVRAPMAVSLFAVFSMRDPTVGGDAQAHVALRRAIAMAFDDDEYTRVFDAGLSTAREQLVPPGIDGHVPGYRNPNRFDPATANALLDRVGFRRGRDGYRRAPDGSPLVVAVLVGTSSDARKLSEFVKRMLDRIGVRTSFDAAPISERLKRMSHCRFAMTMTDWALDVPDGANIMGMFYGKAIGSANASCFADPVFDAAYEKALATPPGDARNELFRTMQARLDAMAVMRLHPARDMLLLKREGVAGPFPTGNDWLQVITLGVDARGGAGETRRR